MLEYKDFYAMMVYASTNWKGCYTPLEIAEYAHDFCNDYEICKKYGCASSTINTFYSSLMEDYSYEMERFGKVDSDLEYWVDELADVAKF